MTQTLPKQADPDDFYAQGLAARAAGDKARAMALFQAALGQAPACFDAWTASADIYLEDGFFLHALDIYARAIHANPDSLYLKEKFLFLLRGVGLRIFHPQLQRLMLLCLQTDGIDFYNAGAAWLGMLKTDPAFRPVYKILARKKYGKVSAGLDGLPDLSVLLYPFFIEGLKKTIVADPVFERALTHLRRYVAMMFVSDRARFDRSGFLPLAEALAQYCFFNGYIFDNPEEGAVLGGLRPGDPAAAAVIACYRPLCALDEADDIAARLRYAIPGLVRRQIDEPREEARNRQAITPLTPIDDTVSRDVRAQYEDFPYPRWTSYSKEIHSRAMEGPLQGAAPAILVAGTGTGLEAVELSHVFPDARILAVDLSLSSLAYGITKARHYGIENIEFRQADILALSALPERFDYIASSGVLHHMNDPFQGWSVLTGLLKPGGLMRIALYSERARRPIVEARALIAGKGYSSDRDGIRRFRSDCPKLLKKKSYRAICGTLDFYAMPECRDLLFHVQEHRFTVPMIRDHVDRLGLVFEGFYLPNAVLAKFAKMFPGGSPLDLNLWDQFERKYPATFISMYRFWCRKP